MAYRGRHERRSPFGCLARIITFLVLVAMLIYPFAEPFML